MHRYLLILLFIFSPLISKANEVIDSTAVSSSLPQKREPSYNIASYALPLLSASLFFSWSDMQTRSLAQSHLPTFKYTYDDYLQYVPLIGQLGFKALGLKGGYSKNIGQTIVADAGAGLITFALVTGIKYSAKRMRPDGSKRNSFPSGHSATAFLSAHLLHLEYGKSYPIVSGVGYGLATATAAGRILNNRHWVSDVFAGAAIGFLSAELGYFLSDLIFQNKANPRLTFLNGWGTADPDRRHLVELYSYHPIGAYSIDLNEDLQLSSTYRTGLSYAYILKNQLTLGGELNAGYAVVSSNKLHTENLPTIGLGATLGYRRQVYSWLGVHPTLTLGYQFPAETSLKSPENTLLRLKQGDSIYASTRIALRWHINQRFAIDSFASFFVLRESYNLDGAYGAQFPSRQTSMTPEVGTAFVLSI